MSNKPQASPSPHVPTPTPFKRSDTQQLFKAHNVTINPKVANRINRCKANQTEYRVIFEGEPETVEKSSRVSIVVSQDGSLVREYMG